MSLKEIEAWPTQQEKCALSPHLRKAMTLRVEIPKDMNKFRTSAPVICPVTVTQRSFKPRFFAFWRNNVAGGGQTYRFENFEDTKNNRSKPCKETS